MDDKLYYHHLKGESFINKLTSIVVHDESLSSVLTVHLACEKILNGWLCYSTNNASFFDGIGFMKFSTKLSLSKNFGLPKEVHDFMKNFNSIRNAFSHVFDKDDMSENEIKTLENCLKPVLKKYDWDDFEQATFSARNQPFSYKDCSNNLKILHMFMAVYFSMNMYFIELKEQS